MRPIRFRARALAVVAASALAVPLLSACDPSGYAAQGKHFSISNQRFKSDLGALLKEPNFVRGRGTGNQTASSEFASLALTFEIGLELVHVQVKNEKIVVTEADRAGVADVLQQQGLDGVKGRFRSWLDAREAEASALQRVHGDTAPTDAEVQAFYDQMVAAKVTDQPLTDDNREGLRSILQGLGPSAPLGFSEKISVDPRYGTYTPRLAQTSQGSTTISFSVVPPQGASQTAG